MIHNNKLFDILGRTKYFIVDKILYDYRNNEKVKDDINTILEICLSKKSLNKNYNVLRQLVNVEELKLTQLKKQTAELQIELEKETKTLISIYEDKLEKLRKINSEKWLIQK
jgi:hypothetical protein